DTVAEAMPPPSGRSTAALSLQQEQLMVLEDALGPSPANNATAVVELGAPVDEDRLRATLRGLVDRHPALRLAIRRGASGYEQVLAEACDVDLAVVACGSTAEVRRAVGRGHLTPFDLTAGGLFRARLIRRADAPDLLALHVSHLVCDGTSMQILLDDIASGY